MRKTIRDPPGKLTLKLKLIQLKRNIIFHPPPFLSSRLIFQGVYSFHDSLIPHDWDIRLDNHSAIPIRWLVKPRLSDYRSLTTRPASNKKGKHKYSYNHNICPKFTSYRIKDMIQVHPRKLTTLTWNLKKAPKGKGKNLQTHNFWGSMLVFGGAKGFFHKQLPHILVAFGPWKAAEETSTKGRQVALCMKKHTASKASHSQRDGCFRGL